ncbi:MAG TPA: hypothetical protein ENF65_02720 [Euryarchaeota archaeon]|nr:MAG: hypothetical protein DRN46_04880 [Thermococci archaeon]HDI10643.1 hypothetical protein [Euryarchaeota archaeon]
MVKKLDLVPLVVLFLLVIVSIPLRVEREKYFEVMGNNLEGAIQTVNSLFSLGYDVELKAIGYTPGERGLKSVDGLVIVALGSKLYLDSNGEIIEIGEGDSDLVPTSIKIYPVKRKTRLVRLDELRELKDAIYICKFSLPKGGELDLSNGARFEFIESNGVYRILVVSRDVRDCKYDKDSVVLALIPIERPFNSGKEVIPREWISSDP